MSRRAVAVWLGLLLAAVAPALAAGRAECDVIPSKILGTSVRYCAVLPENYDQNKTAKFAVLYQLHGLGQSEQNMVEMGGWSLLDDLRAKRKIGDFILVTPAAGATFYVNSRDGRSRYEDFFIREFIPAIERRYRAFGTSAHRGISGISMGGYGALHYAFKYPQMFAAVSAHSAALIEDFPEDLDFGEAEGRTTPFGRPLDPAYWRVNTPFTLARQNAAAIKRLKIYFDCGTEDNFGFEHGAKQLDEELTKLGVRHEYHLYPGRHNIAYFSAHLPASLEFQSHAIAGSAPPPAP